MFTIDQYIGNIQSNLQKHSNELTSNLKRVVAYKFSPAIDLLDFTASIEPINFELSIRMFSMDQGANEVFNEENNPNLFAGSEEVLPEILYHELDNSQREAFFDFYEEHEMEIPEQEQKTFAEWFSSCWKEAGGDALELPAYLVLPEESNSYDLRKSEWIDEEEKWT
ncbi:hypothetical protein [Planococcus chinensis]|uniref:DUF4303 domain-containing protein n=1 Tax=Planococcus chinensis TaxID=272917 RepID=A0ABW4QEH4_9BACL